MGHIYICWGKRTLDVWPFSRILELHKVYHLYRNLLALGWKKLFPVKLHGISAPGRDNSYSSWILKTMTWLSKWAPNKARKGKSQLHILKLFLVPGDGRGRLWLASTRLTLYSDPGDHFWSKNLVLQTSCRRNKSKSKTLLHNLDGHTFHLHLYFVQGRPQSFKLELLWRVLLGIGILCFTIDPFFSLVDFDYLICLLPITCAWLSDGHGPLGIHLISEDSFYYNRPLKQEPTLWKGFPVSPIILSKFLLW